MSIGALLNRTGGRAGLSGLAKGAGLNPTSFLDMIMQGVDWEQVQDDVARQFPEFKPRTRQAQAHATEHMGKEVGQKEKLKTVDERRRDGDPTLADQPVEGEEGLLKPLARAVNQPGKLPGDPVQPDAAQQQPKIEAFPLPQTPPPQLAKGEGTPPGSFPVPNHSAGASGFGSTWGHAAKAATPGGPANIILSE